jgi:hypothetical protein
MKLALIVLLVCGSWGSARARLGDTRDQAEARYGLEKHEGIKLGQIPLLQGAKEITFEYGGWTIRCALMKATDGRDYIIREEYRKLWNAEVMKAGGTITMRDFERDAVFEAEGGAKSWVQTRTGDTGNDLYSTMVNQFIHLSGINGNISVRQDGAIARGDMIGSAITFDLPQAMKYEVEQKAAKEQKTRADALRINGDVPVK